MRISKSKSLEGLDLSGINQRKINLGGADLSEFNIRLRKPEQAVNNTTAIIQAENETAVYKFTELIPKGYRVLYEKVDSIENHRLTVTLPNNLYYLYL